MQLPSSLREQLHHYEEQTQHLEEYYKRGEHVGLQQSTLAFQAIVEKNLQTLSSLDPHEAKKLEGRIRSLQNRLKTLTEELSTDKVIETFPSKTIDVQDEKLDKTNETTSLKKESITTPEDTKDSSFEKPITNCPIKSSSTIDEKKPISKISKLFEKTGFLNITDNP